MVFSNFPKGRTDGDPHAGPFESQEAKLIELGVESLGVCQSLGLVGLKVKGLVLRRLGFSIQGSGLLILKEVRASGSRFELWLQGGIRTGRYVCSVRSPYSAPVYSVRMQLYLALAEGASLVGPNLDPLSCWKGDQNLWRGEGVVQDRVGRNVVLVEVPH